MVNDPGPSTLVERVYALLDRVRYKRIDSPAEMQRVLNLRYEAYLKEGAVPEQDDRRLVDDFDYGSNVYNIGVYIDGELASALRLHRLESCDQRSPALESFEDHLGPYLRQGKRIIDPNRFVASFEVAREIPLLPYITLRPTFLASTYFQTNLVTMTCRAEHQAFYKRGFYARSVCPPRQYPLLSKPISLLLVDFDADAGRILERHPYWNSSLSEREEMFGPGATFQYRKSKAEAAA